MGATLIASGAIGFVLISCASGEPDTDGTAGTGATTTVGGGAGTAGTGKGGSAGSTAGTGTAGSTAGTGTGGSTAGTGTGGSTAGTGTGGSTAGTGTAGTGTGGSTAGSGTGGSSAGTGGSTAAGTGGDGSPGGTGGKGGKGGSAGTGQAGDGASGSGGGSAGGGSCEKGRIEASEVVIMGESFYAIDPKYIQNVIQDNARAAGSLGANESYRNVAVSGQNMNYIATTEWNAATQGGASVKFIIMDGGGIDCLGSSSGAACSSCPGTFEDLLVKMGTAGVEDVIYTRYPEPGNPPGSQMSLKQCLDATMPNMQEVCEASTTPRCHWVDLRPVWVNGDTNDGLHPTQSGGDHVGDLIWSEMVRLCLAQ